MTKLFSPMPNSLHKLRPTYTPAVTPTVRNAPKNIQAKCLTRKFKGSAGLHYLFLKGSLHVNVIRTEVAWTFLSFPNQIYQLQDPLLQQKKHTPTLSFSPWNGNLKAKNPSHPIQWFKLGNKRAAPTVATARLARQFGPRGVGPPGFFKLAY